MEIMEMARMDQAFKKNENHGDAEARRERQQRGRVKMDDLQERRKWCFVLGERSGVNNGVNTLLLKGTFLTDKIQSH
jgi:hypothetical protein